MSRFLSFLFFSLFFLISEGREILLPQTPVSAYEDTESSVSAQLPALDANDSCGATPPEEGWMMRRWQQFRH